MIKVRFSASGYGTTTESYSTRDQAIAAIENEAMDVLADDNGGPERGLTQVGDEWIATSRNGEEIARWEIV